MVGFAIAGLIIGVVSTAVSIGMSVDGQNKAEDRQKVVDAKQEEISTAQNLNAAKNIQRIAAKGRLESELSARLSKKRGNKLRGNRRLKSGASRNYRTADAEIDKMNNKRGRYSSGNTVVG